MAEPVNRQPVGILIRQTLDVSRETALRRHVQIMSGHAAINVDLACERLGDGLHGCRADQHGRHSGQSKVP